MAASFRDWAAPGRMPEIGVREPHRPHQAITMTPGLSQEPSSGSFYTESGTADCDGPIQGQRPTGPGEHSVDGRIGTSDPDTCSGGGEGWGVHSFRFPTASGTKVVKSAVTFTYGGLQNGVLSGEIKGDYFSGTFSVRPTKGDCVSSPVTEFTAEVVGRFHDYRR